MNADAVKAEIVETVKREYRCGMVNLFEGNVSAKVDGRIFITPSQVSKETMTPEMLVEVNERGEILSAPTGLRPSTELGMHLEIYRLRPDVRAVVHNHSLYATAYALCGLPLESDSLTEMNLTLGRVPIVPYGVPGSPDIYRGFADIIGNYGAMLLANHGVVTFAENLELAFSFAEAVEKIAQTLYIANRIGTPQPIPPEDVAQMRAYGERKRAERIERALAAGRPAGAAC